MFQTALPSLLTISLIGLAPDASAFDPKNIVFSDPVSDDNGPGTYTYPTDPVYKPGSFDLVALSLTDKGSTLEIKARMRAKIEDPWNSKSWGGNGFSLQMIQIYLDTKKGGFLDSLPGINIKFPKGQGWDKVIFISPHPKAKILAEVKSKKPNMLKGLVVPAQTFSRGQEIIAVVNKADLGGGPTKDWGFQAIVQSNEGFADADSVLARKVNQDAGQHRFGGGNDHNCDPHVIDMLTGSARGGNDEKEAQYKVLRAYTCDAEGNGKRAVVPLIYPGK
jgi:carbohydrate-binding DOMON domain-containing protein